MINQNEEKGISLVDILSKIWTHRKLIIIITLVASLVLVVPLYFINKSSRKVTVGFEYNFLGVEDGQYPDGTRFDFRTLLSFETLSSVASSKDEYSQIDIEELFLDEDTTIRKQEDELSSERQLIFSKNRYFISLPFKYFDHDEDLARAFMIDLLNVPIEYAIESYEKIQLINQIDLIDDDVEYLESVQYYRMQYDLLLFSYETFIENYGNVSIGNENIQSQYTMLQDQMNKLNTFEELSLLIKQEKYVKNFEKFKELIQLSINYIDETVALNNAKITNLEAFFNNVIAPSNLQQADELIGQIIALKIENIELLKQKTDFQDMIDFVNTQPGNSYNTPTFLQKMQTFETILTDYTTAFNDFQNAYHSDKTTLIFDSGKIVIIDGGLDNIVLALISGVLGFVFAVVIVLVKDNFMASGIGKSLSQISKKNSN